MIKNSYTTFNKILFLFTIFCSSIVYAENHKIILKDTIGNEDKLKLRDYKRGGEFYPQFPLSENDPIKDSGCGVSILPEDPLEMSKAIKEIYNMPLDERKLMGLKGFDYAKIHFSKEAFDNKVIEMLKQSIIK